MENKIYKPKIDKLFWLIWIPTSVFMILMTVFAFFEQAALFIMIPTDIFTFYFLVTSLFGYAELRDDVLFIRFGLIMTREIPYSKIRGLVKERKFHSESMMSLKNALEHVNIKYNTFDIVSVSVVDNDGFIEELNARRRMRTL